MIRRVRMEPAIAQRRRTVRSSTARRRRDATTALVVASALAASVWWVVTGPAVAIRSLTVSGYTRPDAPIIARYVQRALADGTMIDIPEARVRSALHAFPWVQDVVVSRDWPTGVTVRIVETRPIALAVPARGPSAIVSAEGRVLGLAGKDVDRGELPVIRVTTLPTTLGSPLVTDHERDAVTFIQSLPTDADIHVTDVTRHGTGLVAHLDTGLEVRLGFGTRLHAKAIALSAVLARIPIADQRPPAYLDLHDPVRPAFGKDRGSDGTPIADAASAPSSQNSTGTVATSRNSAPALSATPSITTRDSASVTPPSLNRSSSPA